MTKDEKKFLKAVCDGWREFERWLAEHDRLLRKLCRMRITPPKTHQGYGDVKSHPH